ncbi:MAG: hypothetical protein NVSMB27_29320 [Ktedonobacteraceae bacterium]
MIPYWEEVVNRFLHAVKLMHFYLGEEPKAWYAYSAFIVISNETASVLIEGNQHAL